MTCETAVELMSAALDNELPAEEKAQLDRHLAQCDHCRALFDELSAIHAACEGLDAAPPPALRENILNNLPSQHKTAAKVIPIWRRWGAMAAAFALIALAAWRLPRSIFAPSPSPEALPQARETVLAGTAAPAMDKASGSADTTAAHTEDSEASKAHDNSLTAEEDHSGIDDNGTYGTFEGDWVILSDEEYDAIIDWVLNGGAESGQPAPTSLPDYVDGDSVNVNAVAPQKRLYGGFSSAQSAKTTATTESVVNDADMDSGSATSGGAGGGGAAAPDEPPMMMAAAFRTETDQQFESNGEVLEPLPEMPQEEVIAATLFLDGSHSSYCGVLTLSGGTLLNDYPAQVQPSGETWYELPRVAFYALVDELTAGGISADLRAAGEGISAAAETGLVVILP